MRSEPGQVAAGRRCWASSTCSAAGTLYLQGGAAAPAAAPAPVPWLPAAARSCTRGPCPAREPHPGRQGGVVGQGGGVNLHWRPCTQWRPRQAPGRPQAGADEAWPNIVFNCTAALPGISQDLPCRPALAGATGGAAAAAPHLPRSARRGRWPKQSWTGRRSRWPGCAFRRRLHVQAEGVSGMRPPALHAAGGAACLPSACPPLMHACLAAAARPPPRPCCSPRCGWMGTN